VLSVKTQYIVAALARETTIYSIGGKYEVYPILAIMLVNLAGIIHRELSSPEASRGY